ncbi:MAG: Cell wall-binding protein [uncultured Nocardioides sp.]|uniref:Cell wall-binding protein n=1 Tax=uncultured Nocardioides sp. TaxID=198441 RepID=A0A6J4NS66_9ACTN|nr:MAG: Cell wall-binding protein [uncultured Nocardioides sp.]
MRVTPPSTVSRTALSGRLRAIATTTAAAALTLTLAPGVAAAQETGAGTVDGSSRAAEQVSVRVKVATRPAVRVAVVRRAWPSRVLATQDVAVDGNDLVEVLRDGREVAGPRKRVRQGDTVRLVVVEKRRTTQRVRVPARVVEVPTTKLAPGRRKVVREGRAGVQRVVVVRTFHNGERATYRVASRGWVREPRAKRVLVGRRPLSVPGADGLNWGALANCESSGNPRAVNPAGYYGLYQFNVATWRSVGGSGMPHHASAGEQTFRAKLLYKSRGRSPWPHCGRLL